MQYIWEQRVFKNNNNLKRVRQKKKGFPFVEVEYFGKPAPPSPLQLPLVCTSLPLQKNSNKDVFYLILLYLY